MSELKTSKEHAIKVLGDKLTEGESIAKDIPSITDSKIFTATVDRHDKWWQATGYLLEQMFDDKAVADRFRYYPPFVTSDPPLAEKVARFSQSANDHLAKLKEIIANIEGGLYVKPRPQSPIMRK